jgi:hypothetical protein
VYFQRQLLTQRRTINRTGDREANRSRLQSARQHAFRFAALGSGVPVSTTLAVLDKKNTEALTTKAPPVHIRRSLKRNRKTQKLNASLRELAASANKQHSSTQKFQISNKRSGNLSLDGTSLQRVTKKKQLTKNSATIAI